MVKCEIVEEIGVIERVDGYIARVTVLRKTACEGCTVSACDSSGQSMIIEALNPVQAQVGQKVKISMKSSTYLKGTLIVYGIPAIALVIGAVVGREFTGAHFAGHDPDSIAAISGFTAFIISLLSLKIWSSRTERKNAGKPVIEEILESES
jgi:sigma-E factor negative regulatory protein RseC